jgi:hypothetical protein
MRTGQNCRGEVFHCAFRGFCMCSGMSSLGTMQGKLMASLTRTMPYPNCTRWPQYICRLITSTIEMRRGARDKSAIDKVLWSIPKFMACNMMNRQISWGNVCEWNIWTKHDMKTYCSRTTSAESHLGHFEYLRVERWLNEGDCFLQDR